MLEELAKGEYREDGSFIDWILGLFSDLVEDLTDGLGGSGPVQWLLLAVAAVIALALLVLLLRRTGMLRGAATLSVGADLDGGGRSDPIELRAMARLALDSGRNDDAVVLSLRALVRDLDERTLLEVPVGLTAQEVAAGAARPFPELRRRLELAASSFDMAAYSRRSTGAKEAGDVVRLVEYIAQSRPDLERVGAL